MAFVRSLLLVLLPMALFAGQAAAYQYAYPWPGPRYGAVAYHPAYTRTLPAYYPAQAYPAGRARVPTAMRPQAPRADAGAAGRPAAPPAAESGSDKAGMPPDTALSAQKQAFITMLLPHIEAENSRLMTLRREVVSLVDSIEAGAGLGQDSQQRLRKLAREYRIEGNPLTDSAARSELLRKIDTIPASLALAQAVNESAWGQSRFALEANNLFGIWTYDEDKGLEPLRREKGKTHLVRIFDDYHDSVRYYMYTLNSHPAYSELRRIRQQLRDANSAVDGHQLAEGLEKYSAKGRAYIELIQVLISKNRWVLLDSGGQRA